MKGYYLLRVDTHRKRHFKRLGLEIERVIMKYKKDNPDATQTFYWFTNDLKQLHDIVYAFKKKENRKVIGKKERRLRV